MNLTPTQNRIYELLLDGRKHSKDELLGLLWDDMSGKDSLAVHLSTMRPKVPQYIVHLRINGQTFYQLTVPFDPPLPT